MKRSASIGMVLFTVVAALPTSADDGQKKQQNSEQAELQGKEPVNAIKRLAELRLDEHLVPARMINLPLPGRTKTIQDILDRMEEWSKDDKIGAVLMDLSNVRLGLADVEELRGGIRRLRDSGRKVFAFLNGGFSPIAYLIACAADEIVTPPSSGVLLNGIGGLFPFLKGHYQMLGVEFEVITSGRYKYGGFLNRREPDEFFLEEYGAILDSLIADYKAIVTDGRGLTANQVGEIVDQGLFQAPEAQQRGLVDRLAFYDDYRDRLLRREKMKKLRRGDRGLAGVNSIQDFMNLLNEQLEKADEARKAVGPKIAVVHARGPIIDINLGAGFASLFICRDDFIKVVEHVRKNKSIKAVVLRIDSPGGSAYASDVIWQHLRRLGEEKPLVVSMGTVAASGGYYIACPAERIFAQPTTITASIGVLSIFPSYRSRFNRMDYEILPMQRGQRALLGYPHRGLEDEDRTMFRKFTDGFYEIFLERVARTRKMPMTQVRKIAEGRIYSGRTAMELGLVDELGGLADALEAARAMANIPPSADMKVIHYPRPGSLGEIFESMAQAGAAASAEAVSWEVVSRLFGPARTVPLNTQARLFARRPAPLCWLATPAFWEPRSPWDGGIGIGGPTHWLDGVLGLR